MKQLIERWKALPLWQKFMAGTVAVWAIVWASLGATAALAYALGAFGAFIDGQAYARRDDE